VCCEDSNLPSTSAPTRGRRKGRPAGNVRAAQPPLVLSTTGASKLLMGGSNDMSEVERASTALDWPGELVRATFACESAIGCRKIVEKLGHEDQARGRASTALFWRGELARHTAACDAAVDHRKYVEEQYAKSLRPVASPGPSTAGKPRVKRVKTITSGKGKGKARTRWRKVKV
jgi:hypothetical protein